MNWRELKFDRPISIEKLVAEFRLGSTQIFPYTQCKIRIWERKDGTFVGNSNILIKNYADNTLDSTAGLGNTIDETLNDTITATLQLIKDYEQKYGRKLTDEDYGYSASDDF